MNRLGAFMIASFLLIPSGVSAEWLMFGNNAGHNFVADITDVNSELWDSFDVNIVPTMAIFKEGRLEKRWDGVLGRGLTINPIEDANSFFSIL